VSNTSSPLAEHPLKKMMTSVTAQKRVMARSSAFQYLREGGRGRGQLAESDTEVAGCRGVQAVAVEEKRDARLPELLRAHGEV